VFRKISFLLFLILGCVSGYLFHAQYFRWRACFDDAGRCFEATTGAVYFEQSGIAWGGLTLLLVAACLYQLIRLTKG